MNELKNTTDIKTFLDNENLPYLDIWYFLNEDGKKIPLGEKNNITVEQIELKKNFKQPKPTSRFIKSTDPNKKYDEIKLTEAEKKTLQQTFTIYMKHTDNFYCIDIDEPDIKTMDDFIDKYKCETFKNCVWVQGNTKGIHIYIKINDMFEYSDQQNAFKDFKGDLIRKNNMWERKNKPIYNYNDKIEEFNFTDIKYIFTDDFINQPDKTIKTIKIKKNKTDKPEIIIPDKNITTKYPDINDIFELNNVEELQDFVGNQINHNQFLFDIYAYTMILPEPYYGKNSYDKWVKVGWGLRNSNNQPDDLFLFYIWMAFSSKSPDFKISNIIDLYNKWCGFDTNNPNGITVKSIMYWSKLECPILFNEIRFKSISYFIDQTIYNNQKGCGDYDLAKVVAKFVGNTYVCADIKFGIWYEFKNHKWNIIDSACSLRDIISNEVREIYIKKAYEIMEYILKQTKDELNEEEQETLNKTKKIYNKIQEIIQRLGKTCDKKNIIIELSVILKQDKFIDRLDTKPFLLCCSNGVVDIKNKLFRNGEPDDMLSLSTNKPYITKEHLNQDDCNGLTDFFEKIQPYETSRTYLQQHLASCLVGNQEAMQFNNYIGTGANGKSIMVKLMKHTTGDYSCEMPITLFTQKRQNVGNASPEVAKMRGKRYVYMSEPSVGDTINEGIMKQFTGDEATLSGRDLYNPIVEYAPQFKLSLSSNLFCNIKSNDDGTWRRIRVIEFPSSFTQIIDPEKEFNYKIDHDLKFKMEKWAIPLLSYLVDIAFTMQGTIEPCEMVDALTKSYRNKQDRIGQFIQENIVILNGGQEMKTEISRRCNEWFENNYKYKINNKILFDILEKTYDTRGNYFYGLKLINNFNIDLKPPKSRQDCFIELFDRYFEITHNKNHFIKSSRISEWSKIQGLKLDTSKTINPVLLDKYKLDVKNKEHYKMKKIEGYPFQCWFGIIERPEPLPITTITNYVNEIVEGSTDEDENEDF